MISCHLEQFSEELIIFKELEFYRDTFLSPATDKAIKETQENFYEVDIILAMGPELLSPN